jgi:hypothetical protein
MSIVQLRASADLIAEMLRLNGIDARIVGASFDPANEAVVFDIDAPTAPADATSMEPAYRQEYPSKRYFMVEPGWARRPE